MITSWGTGEALGDFASLCSATERVFLRALGLFKIYLQAPLIATKILLFNVNVCLTFTSLCLKLFLREGAHGRLRDFRRPGARDMGILI